MEWDCDGDGELGLGCRVFPFVAFNLLVEGFVVSGGSWCLVRGGGFSIQQAGLGDGCHRTLDCASSDLIFSACVTMAYVGGKGLDELELGCWVEVLEVGISVAKPVGEVAPVVPVAISCLGSLSHDPMGSLFPCSSEQTREISLFWRWCCCQQEVCGVRGKSELNLVRSWESVRR